MTRRPTSRATGLAGALAVGALLLAGCGGGGSSAAAPPASQAPAASPSGSADTHASTSVITIHDFAFSGPSSVAPGSMVTVTNQDAEAHTVTADDGGFDVKVDPGRSATFTAPSKPGRYGYHCTFHSNMHGTLKVG